MGRRGKKRKRFGRNKIPSTQTLRVREGAAVIAPRAAGAQAVSSSCAQVPGAASREAHAVSGQGLDRRAGAADDGAPRRPGGVVGLGGGLRLLDSAGDSAWEALALYVEIPTSAADIVAVFGKAEDGRRRARLLADLVALRMLLRYAQVSLEPEKELQGDPDQRGVGGLVGGRWASEQPQGRDRPPTRRAFPEAMPAHSSIWDHSSIWQAFFLCASPSSSVRSQISVLFLEDLDVALPPPQAEQHAPAPSAARSRSPRS